MDNDVLRRGKPTCHVEFDEATALLVGDALQTLAFQLLAEHPAARDPQRQLAMLALLALASGSRGMAGGQAIDLAAVGMALSVEELEFMHIHKTGALIRRSARSMPARRLLAGTWPLANRLPAVPVVDVFLNRGSTVTLGKTAIQDRHRTSPPMLLFFAAGRPPTAVAHAALDVCASDTARLHALTDYIVDRSF
jgi:farnesyl diphosphate synthase